MLIMLALHAALRSCDQHSRSPFKSLHAAPAAIWSEAGCEQASHSSLHCTDHACYIDPTYCIKDLFCCAVGRRATHGTFRMQQMSSCAPSPQRCAQPAYLCCECAAWPLPAAVIQCWPLCLPDGANSMVSDCGLHPTATSLLQVHKVDTLVSYKADAEG